MTAAQFRKIALSFPETTEQVHMGHPDFRVAGKIFATLGYPGKEWGMVALNADQQVSFTEAEPDAFVPVKGNWGRKGATNVKLRAVSLRSLRDALEFAWLNKAPKRLANQSG